MITFEMKSNAYPLMFGARQVVAHPESMDPPASPYTLYRTRRYIHLECDLIQGEQMIRECHDTGEMAPGQGVG